MLLKSLRKLGKRTKDVKPAELTSNLAVTSLDTNGDAPPEGFETWKQAAYAERKLRELTEEKMKLAIEVLVSRPKESGVDYTFVLEQLDNIAKLRKQQNGKD